MTSPITMAFQPIVDINDGWRPYAYEALLRGQNGESASEILASIPAADMLAFDATCRRCAIEMAGFLGLKSRLSVNISAEVVSNYRYGLHATLRDARELGWPASRIIFEITEHAPIRKPNLLARWIRAARNRGITVALDDVGIGHANLANLLLLRPGMIKLARELIVGIDRDRSRQAIVKGMVEAAEAFRCPTVAEGVETQQEFIQLNNLGIRLMQGYYIARPAIAELVVPQEIHAAVRTRTPPYPGTGRDRRASLWL